MTNSWDLISKSILLITKGQVIFFCFNLKKKRLLITKDKIAFF